MTMTRRRLQFAVSFSVTHRLRHFTSTVPPQILSTPSFLPPQQSPLRAPSFSSLCPTPVLHTTTHNANGDQTLRFLHNFASLVTQIAKNHRNFAALRRIDSELGNIVERLDCASLVFVVKELCRVRKLQRARDLLMEMRRRFVKISDYFWYSVVFDCLVKDGSIADVEIMWNDVCGNDTDVNVSSYVMYVCRFEDLCRVRKVCERVLKDGVVLEGRSYVALIGALCRLHDEGSLTKEVVCVMDRAGVRVDNVTYFVMYQCFCRNGNLDDADWILRRLVKRGLKLDVSVYGSFLYGLCKAGKVKEADKLFHKLIRKGGVEKSTKVNFMRLGRRAIFQLDFGDEVLDVMVYEAYFRSLCRVGRLDEAEMLLKEMMKMRTVPQTCVHNCFVKALFNAGRDSDALKFLNLEKKKQHISTDEIIGSVVEGLCGIGRVDDGLEMFNEVISKGTFYEGTNICNNILSRYWKENKTAEAETFFSQMNGGAYGLPDGSTYSIMIHGLCRQGDITKAHNMFKKLLESKFFVTRVSYEEIIRELSSQGRFLEAHKLHNNMLENKLVVSFDDCDLAFHFYMKS